MDHNNFSLDLSSVDANDGLPNGSHNVAVNNIDLKENKARNGSMVNVEFIVIDGPQQGRKNYENYNVSNPNPQAVEIGTRNLKRLLMAAFNAPESQFNQVTWGDIQTLKDQRLSITIGTNKNGDSVIKQYRPFAMDQKPTNSGFNGSNNQPSAGENTPPPASGAPANSGGGRPWER